MAKQVENFEKWGYRVHHDSKGFATHRYISFARWTDIYQCETGKNPDVPINTFGVRDEYKDILLIPRAYNNSPDHDPRPKEKKLSLRDQVVSYWCEVEHRSPSELRRVVYANVIEDALVGVIKDVYDMLGAPENKDLTITPSDPPFDVLLNRTPFGAGMQKMLNEYADLFANKRIESFQFHLADGMKVFDFIINLS
ncbi:hypothetical protein diail_7640 [Diaporthe ilicicola]|nr:hypothetical protein diail_7640 [Diaporthe ilicicola]